MGLAQQMGWTGVDQFVAPRRNTLISLGASLLNGKPGIGVAEGMQADTAYATQQKAETERQQQINQTAEWLKTNYPQYSSLPAEQGFQLAMRDMSQAGASPTSDIQNYEYAQANPGFADWQTQRGGASEISLTPTWGIDTDPKSPTYNKMVLGQLGKDNKFHRTEMGGVQPVDPAAMIAQKTGVVADEKAAGAARTALPAAEQAYAITKKALGSLTGNANVKAGQGEQFSNTLGIPTGQVIGAIPGTYKSDFRNTIEQLSGQAFLQIRNALKGAGQVTDYEGAKGEIAISRMRAAAERGSEADFNQAVIDFNEAIDNGMRLLREQAQGAYAQGGAAVSGGAPASAVDPVAAADALLNSGKY